MKNEPPEEMIAYVLNMVQGPTEGVIAALGESPEAWRGAFLLLDHLREGARMTAEICVSLNAEKDTAMQSVTLVQTAALVVFDKHEVSMMMRQALGMTMEQQDLGAMEEWLDSSD